MRFAAIDSLSKWVQHKKKSKFIENKCIQQSHNGRQAFRRERDKNGDRECDRLHNPAFVSGGDADREEDEGENDRDRGDHRDEVTTAQSSSLIDMVMIQRTFSRREGTCFLVHRP